MSKKWPKKMKKQLLSVVFTTFLMCLISCTDKVEYRTIDGFAQGTTYHIVYADSLGRDLRDTIDALLADFDRSLSLYESNSQLIKLNENRQQQVDMWFCESFEAYKLIYSQSGGLLDPTLRPLIAIYGFGGKQGQPRTPSQAEIDSIMAFVGLDKVKIEGDILVKDDNRIELDFNALAQGYSVDVVGQLLEKLGVRNYMIEIGGEVFARGVNDKGGKWRIGIDSPKEGNNSPGADFQGIIELSDRGLATSGNYRKSAIDQNGERITHTIDPRTGRPSSHNLLSATLLAPTAALADGYATACMVGGLEWSKAFLAAHEELDGFLVFSLPDGQFGTYSTFDVETPRN